MPKFILYKGTTDPYSHLVSFCTECSLVIDNDTLSTNYFRESLKEEALMWFTNLLNHETRTFEDIINKFMSQYRHLGNIKPTWHNLANCKQKSEEEYEDFVTRWHHLYARTSIKMKDDEAITWQYQI